jgi:hypothetical protein
MNPGLPGVSKVAYVVLVTILAAGSVFSQTPETLRAKYGEPQERYIKNGRTTFERYLVTPNIQLTVTYTKAAQLCKASFDPVPSSTPTVLTLEHPPEGDYMSTADVITVINELVPLETRGKSNGAGSMNGGDPEIEMKLNHPGCWGSYTAFYENVTIYTSSWCWGGTFSATVHWSNTKCRSERLTITKKR